MLDMNVPTYYQPQIQERRVDVSLSSNDMKSRFPLKDCKTLPILRNILKIHQINRSKECMVIALMLTCYLIKSSIHALLIS